MDIKTMFPSLSLMWVRWSEYEIVRRMDNGVENEYIVPVPGAEEIVFNCAEHPEPMVTDAILIGQQIHENAIPVKLIDLLCTNFASHYGLFGQALGMDLSAPVYSSAPLYYAPNSEKYGEELFYFKDRLHRIYRHYMTTQGEWNRGQKSDFGIYGTLSYRLTPGRTPQIVWGVETMEEVMWLTYASLITGERPGLKVCKNCGRVYYSSHAKSEFCGAKCRNRYNVKMFRSREKQKSAGE